MEAPCRSAGKAGTCSLPPWTRSAPCRWRLARHMPCRATPVPVSCWASPSRERPRHTAHPFIPRPPQLWLPDAPDSEISWQVEVRPAADGAPLRLRGDPPVGDGRYLAGRAPADPGGFRHHGPRPPRPRDAPGNRRRGRCLGPATGPPVRALTGERPGARPGGTAAPACASRHPARLSFRAADRVPSRSCAPGPRPNRSSITPPHVEAAVCGRWCAAAGPPRRSAPSARHIPDLGRLLVRAPGMVADCRSGGVGGPLPSPDHPVERQGRRLGSPDYDLARASETVAHHGRAEFFLPWGQGAHARRHGTATAAGHRR